MGRPATWPWALGRRPGDRHGDRGGVPPRDQTVRLSRLADILETSMLKRAALGLTPDAFRDRYGYMAEG